MVRRCRLACRLIVLVAAALLVSAGSSSARGGHGGGGGHGSGGHGGHPGHFGHHGHFGHNHFAFGIGFGYGFGYGGYGWGYPWGGYSWGYDPGYYSGIGGYPAWYYAAGPGPVIQPAPAAAPADNTAHLRIRVPAEQAEVWLNDVRTKQTGAFQQYQVPAMTPGQTYSYEVRARWLENGQSVERSRTVLVHANEQVNIDLARTTVADTPAPASNTAHLRIRVPASQAELWLNGVRTKQTAGFQQYQTPLMTPGQTYAYEIRARWTDNGRTVERVRTVHVRANEQVNIDLAQTAVASK
jgi:uncharacterized protein (TIGR03000 family)